MIFDLHKTFYYSIIDPIEFLPRDAMRKRGLCCRPVSVRMSVCHVGALYPDGWRYRQTSLSARYPHHSSFLNPSAGTQFHGEAFQRRRENFAIFD